jgi:arginine N-succinyltransferase
MFLLRSARRSDLAAVRALANHLDSPNLPKDEAFLEARLLRSERSFALAGPPSAEAEYQFVLVDDTDEVVGTCAILSKHGTPDMPHVFLRVCQEHREAASLKIRVAHLTLQLGSTEDGPTEIGALVLRPDVRGKPGWPGKLLSWGRFAYIACHPASFERFLLAEMRASLTPDGKNRFWEAFGHRFTGLSYAEADRRSTIDKSFILDLFPSTPFYASLLDPAVAEELGKVHPEARPALRLLERAGFHWIGEIDPFDAGPFYGADQSEVVPIRELWRGAVALHEPAADARPGMIIAEEQGEFRALAARAETRDGELLLSKEARDRLELQVGDDVGLAPLPISS